MLGFFEDKLYKPMKLWAYYDVRLGGAIKQISVHACCSRCLRTAYC